MKIYSIGGRRYAVKSYRKRQRVFRVKGGETVGSPLSRDGEIHKEVMRRKMARLRAARKKR